eukprot:366000-Chlamydomonas_euryale.AAC.24
MTGSGLQQSKKSNWCGCNHLHVVFIFWMNNSGLLADVLQMLTQVQGALCMCMCTFTSSQGAMLAHPYVVEFVKSWIRDGHEVNIVYGYCEQGDLQTAVKRRKVGVQLAAFYGVRTCLPHGQSAEGKHFDEVQLRRWLAQMLLALQYLQTKHVLHRDLKTCNIFVTSDGDVQDTAVCLRKSATVLQIGDFGLATLRETGISSSHDQSIVGTPHFMSPEVLSRKKYDYKTDVWYVQRARLPSVWLTPCFGHCECTCVNWMCVLRAVCVQASVQRLQPDAQTQPTRAIIDLQNGLVSKITKGALPALPAQYSNDWSSLIKR